MNTTLLKRLAAVRPKVHMEDPAGDTPHVSTCQQQPQ
jgi:hypothetical protein